MMENIANLHARVLIVDDEYHIRKSWTILLEQNEYEVYKRNNKDKIEYGAKNGVDAKKIIVDWHPDVIILDLSMPTSGKHEGFRVLKFMSKRNLKIPVIIVTGVYFNEDDVKKELDKQNLPDWKNWVSVIIKPVSNEALLNTIGQYI